MKASSKTSVLLILLGDALAFYVSLALVVYLRYANNFTQELVRHHLAPFSWMFPLWLAVFYVFGLYEIRLMRNTLDFFQGLLGALIINAVLSSIFFYLIPAFAIAPKTNLLLFILVFGLIEFLWRRLLNRATADFGPRVRTILWGTSETANELYRTLQENPQFGYEVVMRVAEATPLPLELKNWEDLIRTHQADLIVVPRHILKESRLAKIFFDLFDSIEVRGLDEFYEEVFRKVPTGEIDESWFLEHAPRVHNAYQDLKRVVDFTVALVAQIVFLPLEIVIMPFIFFTSPGPIIYRQTRVGRDGRHFTFYKFRTMRMDAEKDGPQWAALNDSRTTPVGRFLRRSHLDELPQFLNVLRGDLSFVGPRPERPEFVTMLKKEVSFYEMRSMIKPGITGWAQIHHHTDLTVEDVKQKIQYDLYYLKNRSLALDLAIILKTFKTFFITPHAK